MKVLTHNDYKIMSKILNVKEKKGISKLTGVTRKQLMELANVSYTKTGDALKLLMEYGFVDHGISNGRERTYYLTQKGMLELKNIAECSIEVNKGGNVNE